MDTTTTTQLRARIAALRAEIAANRGKPSTIKLRTELDRLVAESDRQAAYHAKAQKQLHSLDHVAYRTQEQRAATMNLIIQYATATITRQPQYGHLLVNSQPRPVANNHPITEERPQIAARILRHPALTEIATYLAAWTRIDAAANSGYLPLVAADINNIGLGASVNHALYAYANNIALVQVGAGRSAAGSLAPRTAIIWRQMASPRFTFPPTCTTS